eukprot:SAG11_NODE_681_length_7772_cov_26.403362_4_plen_77_part_00
MDTNMSTVSPQRRACARHAHPATRTRRGSRGWCRVSHLAAKSGATFISRGGQPIIVTVRRGNRRCLICGAAGVPQI